MPVPDFKTKVLIVLAISIGLLTASQALRSRRSTPKHAIADCHGMKAIIS